MRSNAIFIIFVLFNFAFSQNADLNEKSISAIKIDEAPVIDGDVMGDPVWEKINPITACCFLCSRTPCG